MNVREQVRRGRDARVNPIADEIGVPSPTIYSQIRRGEYEVRRVGRVIVIPNALARRLLGMEAPAA